MAIANSIAAGALFGAALTAAGVYSPSVIIGQLQLSDFHMLKAFLAASASSALAILAAQKLSLTTCKPRTPNTVSLFSKYDGNIIGGLLLGVGMALSGACPGTLLPQVATGVSSGPFVLLGGVLGGVIHAGWIRRFVNVKRAEGKDEILKGKDEKEKAAVYEVFGGGKVAYVAVYEILCLAVLLITSTIYPEKANVLIPAVLGGCFIGLSQFTSLFLTGSTLGVSNAYEQIGDLFWYFYSALFSRKTTQFPNIRGTAFSLGTIVGTIIVSKLVTLPVSAEVVSISTGRAVIGGALLILGGRIGGGCTSGHGISGMAQLSISSFFSVAAMFGGGIAFASLMRVFDL